jgi:hypothetical protein
MASGLSLPARAHARSLLARGFLAALVAATVIFALIAVSPGHMLIRNPGRVVPLPHWFVGPLVHLHLPTTGTQQAVVLLAMCAAYIGVLAFGSRLRTRPVAISVVVVNVLFALAPPLLSSDVFSYIVYGRIGALHGLNPYKVTPAAVPGDPISPFVGWHHIPTIYGPLFTLGSYPLGLVSFPVALWLFKAIACISSLVLVALVWRAAKMLGRPPAAAAAAVGLNPILLVWAVGGAHNDLLMLAVMLGGVVLLLGERKIAGGAALVAAVAIKVTAGAALPFVLIGASGRRRVAAGMALAGVACAALAAISFPDHALNIFHTFQLEQRLVALRSVPNEVSQLLGGGTRLSSTGRHISSAVLLASFVALAVRVWVNRDWLSAAGWALLALALTSPWFVGWYAIWPLPFAALSRDRKLLVGTLLLQAFVVGNIMPRLLA